MAVRPFTFRHRSRSTAINRGRGGVFGRRFLAVVAAALLAGIPGTVVLAGSGDPTGTISMSVPNHAAAPLTVSLSGTWVWPEFKTACGPGTGPNRAAGWAIDWGDGFTGNRSLRKNSNPASYAHLGDATDNTVHRSTRNSGLGDCGTPTPQGATGTWEPITHTYPGPGTYTACVSIYDVHYKNVDRTKLSAAITGQTTFNVANGSTLAVGDVLLIDKEQMLVTGVTGNTITVTRGVNGTAVANHKKDTVVKEIVPSDPKQLVAGSNAAKYGTGDHNADNSVETNKTASTQCLPVTFRVYGPSSISVDKTANVTQAHVGDTVTYTFTVTNPGDSPLIVQVLDPKCDHPGDLGQHTGDTNLDTNLDKTETWTYTCTHVVTDGDGDPLRNTVSVRGIDKFGTEVTASDHADVHVLPPTIVLFKSGDTQVHHGDQINLSFAVTDLGPGTVHDVHVSDDHCSPVSTDPTTKLNDNGNAFLDPIGANGTTPEVWVFTCRYPVPEHATGEEDPIHDVATATAQSGNGTPVSAQNGHTTDILHPRIAVTKTADVTQAHVGDTVHYTFTVTNAGDVPLFGVVVTDAKCDVGTLSGPTGDDDHNTKLDTTEIWRYTCTHTIVAGDSDPLHNTVTASASDPLARFVTDTDEADVDILNASPTIATQIDVIGANAPGLGFTSLGDSATLTGFVGSVAGETVTFTLYGPYASGVTPTCTGTPAFQTTGTLSAGGNATTSQTSSPAAAGTYVWIASYPGDSLNDPVTGKCTDANEAATIVGATVDVTKHADLGTVSAGDTIGFTITAENKGTVPALGTVITDSLPAGADFVWSVQPGVLGCSISGAIGGQTLTCNVGTLPGSSVFPVHIMSSTTRNDCGVVNNKATVTTTNGTGGDSDTATIAIDCAGLSLTKTADAASVNAGSAIGFTVTAANSAAAGTGTAHGVIMSDPLPFGSGIDWHVDNQTGAACSISGVAPAVQTVTCALGDFAPGATYTVHVTSATAIASCGDYHNFATLTSSNAAPIEKAASETVNCPVAPADIEITKTDNVDSVVPGQVVTYHVDVFNHATTGSSVSVSVTDIFPAGLTNISWMCDGATLGGSNPADCGMTPRPTYTGDIHETATLFPGGHVGYAITATVAATATGTIVNTATAAYAGDPDTSNNTATDTDIVGVAGNTAEDDYTGAIGNTKLAVGVTVAGEPVVSLTGSVLTNDTGTGTLTATLLTPNPPGGRIVTMNSNGSFTYLPAPGFTGTDTFLYTLKDNGTTTGVGTVKVAVSNMVWYVNNALASAGDGRSTSPFNSIAPLTGAGDPDGSGDIIFVYTGSGNYGGITLEANQKLLGQPNGLAVASDTLVAAGGSNPVLVNGSGNCITLASGNEIQGVSTGNCSGTGIAGTSVGTLTVGSTASVNVENGTGKAVDIDTGVLAVTLSKASSTGSATNGVRLANTTGTFTATSGTIQTAAGDGVSLSAVTSVSLSGMTIKNNLGSGIKGVGVAGFSITGSAVTGNGDDAAADEAGIRFDGLTGAAVISSTEVSGSVKDNVRIINSSGSLTSLTMTGDTIKDNSATTGNDGLTLEANGNATMTISVSGGTFSGNRSRGIKATTNGAGHLDLTVANGTYTTNLIHVDIADNSTGGLKFNVNHNTLSTTNATDGSPINVFLGTAGTGVAMTGTIDSNTITNDNSPTGPGINVLATGTGKIVVAITGNNVTQVANLGISAIASQGSSQLEATITGNTVTLASSGAINDIFVASGSSLTTDTNAVCASISGNTATTASSSGDTALRVRNRQAGTTFRLPGFGGLGSSDAAVVTFLSGANGGASASATHSADFTAGGAACQTPP